MMQERMLTQRAKNSHCLSVASLTVFQLNLLVISEWSVWVVLWNFLHKKFPPSAQDKKTILPPQAVPLPLQGRLNVSLTGQHPPKLPLTKRDIQSPFVRQSLIREEKKHLTKKTTFLIRSIHYSLFTTHHTLIYNDTDFSRFTSNFSLKAAGFTSLPLDIQKSNYIHLLTCSGFLCYL